MNPGIHSQLNSKFVAKLFGGLAIFIGVVVLLGWHFDISILKSLLPGFISMKVNTALALIFFGCLNFNIKEDLLGEKKQNLLSNVSLLLVTLIGALTLFEYLTNFDLGIDEFFYADSEGVAKQYPPGRLAPITAISFVLMSFSVYFQFFSNTRWPRLAQALFFIVAMISLQAIIAYALGVKNTFGIASHTRIALHTAIALIFLCLGFLLLGAKQGYMNFLMAPNQIGASARRLLAIAILIPGFVKVLETAGLQSGFYDAAFSPIISIMASIILLTIIVLKNIENLNAVILARDKALAENLVIENEKSRIVVEHDAALEREQIELELHKELIKARQIAERATHTQADFLANMSHEIRTPLNGIMGMTAILSSSPLSTDQREKLEIIRDSSNTLHALINQILDLSKIEAGFMQLEEAHFELRSLVESTVSIVTASAQAKGIKVKCLLGDEVPDFYLGDSLRLRQVFLNLLNNAIKFSTSGTVELKISKISEENSMIGLAFEVSDQGPGMDSQTIGRLFKKFSQGDDSTTRKFGGTGLGLAITKELVQLMGGSIKVESSPDKGSRFFFQLDLKAAKYRVSKSISPNSPLETKLRIHVLVAEDNLTNQKVVGAMLTQFGCTFEFASTGAAAIDLLKEKNFDVVLMDGQMPEMNGYEATQHIRDGKSGQNKSYIPIIAVTANAIKGDLERCLAAGMDDYISKPILPDDLRSKLQKWSTATGRILDLSRLKALRELEEQTSSPLLQELLDIFVETTPQVLNDLKLNLELGKIPELNQLAHSFKSTCANLGAIRMKNIAERLEKIKSKDEFNIAIKLVDSLDAEYRIALLELRNYAAA